MATRLLKSTLKKFSKELVCTETHVDYAYRWSNFRYPKPTPQFTYKHRDIFIEAVFLDAFQAWEEFLEESFILYILGKRPPRGKRLYSVIPVETRKHAKHMLLQGKQYLDWSPVKKVTDLNKNIFEKYDTNYFSKLSEISAPLNDISKIRNAIAHRSENSWEGFKKIARERMRGAFHPNMTVGRFLVTTVPGSSPPETFLDYYLEYLRLGANMVVPS